MSTIHLWTAKRGLYLKNKTRNRVTECNKKKGSFHVNFGRRIKPKVNNFTSQIKTSSHTGTGTTKISGRTLRTFDQTGLEISLA